MHKEEKRKYQHRETNEKDMLLQDVDSDGEDVYGFIEEGVWYPTSRFVEDTHDKMLTKYGGHKGFERGISVYEIVLGEAKKTEGICGKAAVFFDGIGKRRIFGDANHRTAQAIMEIFIQKNGITLADDLSEEIHNVIKGILNYSLNEIEELITKWCFLSRVQ